MVHGTKRTTSRIDYSDIPDSTSAQLKAMRRVGRPPRAPAPPPRGPDGTDLTGDLGLRALMSETPGAEHEYRQAQGHADRSARDILQP